MKVVITGSMITVLMLIEVSKLSVGSVTLMPPGVALGVAVGAGVGEAVGAGVGDSVGAGDAVGAGVGDGDAVGDGEAVGDAVGAGVAPVMVIRPLFCGAEVEFRSASMNSKSSLWACDPQTNVVIWPGVLLTRFQW